MDWNICLNFSYKINSIEKKIVLFYTFKNNNNNKHMDTPINRFNIEFYKVMRRVLLV